MSYNSSVAASSSWCIIFLNQTDIPLDHDHENAGSLEDKTKAIFSSGN